MTVACVESLALRECLAKGTQGIARRFFQMASRFIETPWQIAVGSDLQNPRVEGKRTAQVRFVNWYIAKFYRAAQRDGALATKFLEVGTYSTATLVEGAKPPSHGSDRPQSNTLFSRAPAGSIAGLQHSI
jgi:hypothetical protein